MTEKLILFFKQSPEEAKNKVPEGVCPNCWGEQEYDNRIRNMYRDKQIDVNNHEKNFSFIQEFVINRINGIQLIKGNNSLQCPACKKNYDKQIKK
jgi:hypothetical protein